ncbi:hypothetical protein NPIL_232311 [Nephila pilipes]|uniref:Uncharacterized protein n=1 Tax=Nephila pilipes TaxID=299642 RepID=A0A8X6ND92_NEPPI|nr:hypothetical protein NPIL_232311 [Nephila pilipes]
MNNTTSSEFPGLGTGTDLRDTRQGTLSLCSEAFFLSDQLTDTLRIPYRAIVRHGVKGQESYDAPFVQPNTDTYLRNVL